MKKKEYNQQLHDLQVELVSLQAWVRHAGLRVVVVFEGRDTAGKGGLIKALTDKVSPRIFRVVALPAPTEREKTQLYMQRYMQHMPAAGEVVLFDRSWYNRACVEPVMGFCTPAQTERFLEVAPRFEDYMIDSGIVLLKYWLEVGSDKQKERLASRVNEPIKQWKLSSIDLAARERWYAYSRARDRMFAATDTELSPWYIVPADDKREARINCISHMLNSIPYEPIETPHVEIPARDKGDAYDDVASLAGRKFVG
jgi:polyphosphate kinase 2